MTKITKEYLNQLDEKMDMIPLSYDLVFKSIFKLNLNLLVDFLNTSLKIEIAKDDKIRILDSELPVTNKNERKKMIDIIVSINDKIFIDIEMNRSKFEYVMERNFNYLDKIATIIFEKGKSIKDINNIQLNLNISPFEEDLEDIIVPSFQNNALNELKDGAILINQEHPLVFSTDSFVVDPWNFSGGDIGKPLRYLLGRPPADPCIDLIKYNSR